MPFGRHLERFRLPASAPVSRRAPDLTYSADERPSSGQLLALGLQHAAAALTLLTYVLAAAAIGGLAVNETQNMVAATALSMALCTALQAWGGRVGAGRLLVHMPNPMLIGLVGLTVARYGPGSLVAITLITALSALLVSFVLPKLRTFFPPTVAGVVVCIGGLTLIRPALQHASGMGGGGGGAIDIHSVAVAMATLLTIATCSVWGSIRLRLAGTLLGLVAGLLVAGLFGQLAGFSALADAPWMALPHFPDTVLLIDPAMVTAIAVVAVLSQLDTLGSVVMMQKMDDAQWRRANLTMAARAMRANGMGELALSALGPFPTATSSTNIALCHISRTTSRYVGLLTALMLALVAVLPQITLALTLLPIPIIGAVELYAAAFLIVSGIELIAQRAMDSRGIFMVGMSLVLGLGVVVLPELAEQAPGSLELLLSSGLVVAGVCAIVLNLVFRLGSAKRTEFNFGHVDSATAITDFVNLSGANWGARRDVISRAALAVLEASEAIAASAESRKIIALRGQFDEYNMAFEIVHTGPAMPLPAAVGTPEALADLFDDEHDDAIDQALARASSSLLHHLADEVRAETRDGQALLRLHFEH